MTYDERRGSSALAAAAEGLTGMASSAVLGWTYAPATFEGVAIPVCLEVTVEFKLESPTP